MAISRVFARPMLASMFVVGGFDAVRNADKLADKAAPVTRARRAVPQAGRPAAAGPDDPVTLVRLNGGRPARSPAPPWPPAGRRGSPRRCWPRPWSRPRRPGTGSGRSRTPQGPRQQRIHFFKNVSMLGGADARRRRHRGQAGRRLAHPRGPAEDARREAAAPRQRGPARGALAKASDDVSADLTEPWPAPRATGPVDARRLAARQQVADQPGTAARRPGRRPLRRTTRTALAGHPADGRGAAPASAPRSTPSAADWSVTPGPVRPRRVGRLRSGRDGDAVRAAGRRPVDAAPSASTATRTCAPARSARC